MNIEGVKGPGGGTDPTKGGSKKDKVKGEEFKEFMKIEEVDETDTEQRRKRKQRAEEPEKPDKEAIESHTVAEPNAPFEPLKPGPAEVKSSAFKVPPSTRPPSPMDLSGEEPAIPSIPEPPKEEETVEEPGMMGASSTPDAFFTPPRTERPTREPVLPSEPRGIETPTERVAPSSERREATPSGQPAAYDEGEVDLIEQKRNAEKKETFIPEPPPVLEETESFFKTLHPPAEVSKSEEEAEIQGADQQALPLPVESAAESAPTEEEEALPITNISPNAPPPTDVPPQVEATAPPSYTQLSPQTLHLFERMVGVITIMQITPGITETAIHLTSEQFASSLFYGVKIVISEDVNARNQFNITINAPLQAVELLRTQVPHLRQAFERGGYTFEIKQITINIAEESEGEFKRKPKTGDDQQQGGGQRQ